MRVDRYEHYVDMFADEGMDLMRDEDETRAKRVSCPLVCEIEWIEVPEVIVI